MKKWISMMLAAALMLSMCPRPVQARAAEHEESPCVVSEAAVYEAIMALKDEYPEGMPWTNDKSYFWSINETFGFGCAAFSFILSDAAFGDLPSRTIYNDITIDDLRVGDILRIKSNTHSVVVAEVHEDYVVLTEGNYKSSIHWGRIYTAQDVIKNATYVVTRYPRHSFEDGACTACGESEDAACHDYRGVISDPTCAKQGYTTHTCTICADVYVDSYQPTKPHTFGKWTTRKATCTEPGEKYRKCTGCGYVESIELPATGHSYNKWYTATQATCTAEGAMRRDCSKCKAFEMETIPAAGHSYVPEVVAATCTEPGYTRFMCYCGDQYDEGYTAATGHTAVIDAAIAATCTADGLTEGSHCTACGEVLTAQEPIPATGHTYVDGACAMCGVSLEAPVVKITNKASSGKPRLSWDKVDGATKYRVYRATSRNGTYKVMKTTTSTTYTNTTATTGKLYYYYVIAVDANGLESDKSNIVSRTCDLAQPEITVKNRASDGAVTVKWGKVEGAVRYAVYRASSKTGKYTKLGTTTKTSYNDSNAAAGKTYYYKVRALCDRDAAASAYSEIKARTRDLAQPKVKISSKSGKPYLQWDKVSNATGYKIYRAASKNGTYSQIGTTTNRNYKDAKAKSGKTCYYKVVAVCKNTAGNSAYSAVVSIKSK